MAEKNSKLYTELRSMPSGKETELVGPAYINDLEKRIPKVSNGQAYFDKTEWLDPKVPTDGLYRIYYKADNVGGGQHLLDRNFIWLVEFKDEVDFADKKKRAEVYLQVCCYIRQIHDLHYEKHDRSQESWENFMPKVIMLGSRINAVAIPAKFLVTIAKNSYIEGYQHATEACRLPRNKYIIDNIVDDAQINAYSAIYDIKSTSELDRLCENIIKYGTGEGNLQEDLSSQTIYYAFDYFDMKVLDKKQSEKMTSREKVSAFIGLFFNPDSIEIKKRRELYVDTVIINGISIKVNGEEYNNFTIIFRVEAEKYTKAEKKQITAITDRLIEETDRRRKGDFYTPTIWVDEAHKLLSKNLGEDWREEYMVWDCAWGTGNLTRDYRFKDLYCSTLEETDLQIGFEYNKNACKFQYDFLNDDVEDFERIHSYLIQANKLVDSNPEMSIAFINQANNTLFNTKLYKNAPGLIDGLLGLNGKPKKKLLFLINPPYATSGVIGAGAKAGTSDTIIKDLMKDNKISGSDQLWIQFIYRIYTIKKLFNADVKIGAFTPSKILSLVKGKEVNSILINEFGYFEGYGICAANFADVKPNWGISFTLWGSGVNNITKLHIMGIDDGNPSILQEKEMRVVLGNDRAIEWAKKSLKAIKSETLPRFTSAINYNDNSSYDRNTEALAVFCCDLGIVETNMQRVAILPSRINANWTFWDITRENFDRAVSFFTARKLIIPDWMNWQDEYMVPDIKHPYYEQWQNDCIVYSLFNGKSQQSSLRNISYKGKNLSIQNEFFWMSVDEMQALAEGKYNRLDINNTVEDDIEEFGFNRFVYKKLKEVTLSPDAKAVLDKATELVKSSFRYRNDFNKSHPEYQINTWDAGWYQIKGLLKEYDPDGLREFNSLYKAFEDRMRPLVYELGFLYK